MKIVVWPVQPEALVEAIRSAAGGTIVDAPQTEAEALRSAAGADGWIGQMNPALLAAAPNLRWLQAWTTSLERVIFPELAAKTGIALTRMKHIYDDHISTHVLAFFLGLCRGIPNYARGQLHHEWVGRRKDNTFVADHVAKRNKIVIRDPAKMVVLVLGLGGIGAEVTRRLKVFGPRIIGVDPKVDAPPAGVDQLERPERLVELIGGVDAVIICAPQTPQTTGLFDEAMLARMKPGALLINVGRGKIVKLDALERALADGRLGGAGLDVFETEPLPESSPLWEMENVIVTPHVAGTGGRYTEERRLKAVLENVRRFAAGEPLMNVAAAGEWY